jgi:predicted  nucleic acid-binding Zn-ribbon protein
MTYQDEMEKKASMHDHWQNKAIDLLCEIVDLKSKIYFLEWREKFLSEQVDDQRMAIKKLEDEIKELEKGA